VNLSANQLFDKLRLQDLRIVGQSRTCWPGSTGGRDELAFTDRTRTFRGKTAHQGLKDDCALQTVSSGIRKHANSRAPCFRL
jgi:hypothetical protein